MSLRSPSRSGTLIAGPCVSETVPSATQVEVAIVMAFGHARGHLLYLGSLLFVGRFLFFLSAWLLKHLSLRFFLKSLKIHFLSLIHSKHHFNMYISQLLQPVVHLSICLVASCRPAAGPRWRPVCAGTTDCHHRPSWTTPQASVTQVSPSPLQHSS
jgi:hypothetical protein